jgi:D-alanyl-D-alanine carboxypeptidase
MRSALASLFLAVSTPLSVAAEAPPPQSALSHLLASYPEHLARIEGNNLIWHDGTSMPIDDGQGTKPFAAWLANPDIKDMLAQTYPAGAPATAPSAEFDPGRARNAAFFAKMYGDCRKGEVVADLVDVIWLPRKSGKRLKVTRRNGVAARLTAVSARLDALPATFDRFLLPPAGTYACRPIAGTDRASSHGYGMAIDIAVAPSHYWRWAPGGTSAYANQIPPEIVAAFEAEGFIWGGRWHHFDTMHFEYRPEMFQGRLP